MNLMEYLNARANNGIALLEEFHHVLQQTTTEQFAVDFGYRVAEVKKLRRAFLEENVRIAPDGIGISSGRIGPNPRTQ